jgi:hypothetical protein
MLLAVAFEKRVPNAHRIKEVASVLGSFLEDGLELFKLLGVREFQRCMCAIKPPFKVSLIMWASSGEPCIEVLSAFDQLPARAILFKGVNRRDSSLV